MIRSRSRRPRLRRLLGIGGWTLATLVLLDVGAGLAFRLPDDPRVMPSALANYFAYGWSTEAKLARVLGPDDARGGAMATAGWIDRDCRTPPPAPAPGTIGVTMYGMSFTDHIAKAMAAIDPTVVVTGYAGPGAPLSHSVACAEELARHGRDPNPIRVVGVLSSMTGRLLTLGGLTTTFEAPTPFTYPRYRATPDGGLSVEQPVVRSSADLRDPARRTAYVRQLAAGDAFYDPWQFDASITDRSVLLRMLRRAYAQHEGRERRARLVSTEDGQFQPEVATVAGRLLLRFAAQARADGAVPVVLLLQDKGGAPDMLERAVLPVLDRNGIAVVSSRDIASNAEPANFVTDGHFTPEVDRRIAERVLEVVRAMDAQRPTR